MDKITVYRVTDDFKNPTILQFYDNLVEAEFCAKELTKDGKTAHTHPVNVRPTKESIATLLNNFCGI